MLSNQEEDSFDVSEGRRRSARVRGLEDGLFRVQKINSGHATEVPRQERLLAIATSTNLLTGGGVIFDFPTKMSMRSKIYGYARALRGGARNIDKNRSEYNKRMQYLSNSIFGEYKVPISLETKRLVDSFERRPYENRTEIVNYYPAHDQTAELMTRLRDYGLFRDEHKDYVEEMERQRKLRGKSKFDRKKKS